MQAFCVMSASIAAVLLTGCATTYNIQPVARSGNEVRFEQGTPITTSNLSKTSVYTRPIGVNQQGRLVFGVAAANNGSDTVNFGIENVYAIDDLTKPIKIYTADELRRQAKNRATWAVVATALAGGLAAAAANANAYSHTSGYVSSPYGVTNFYARRYDATAAAVGTATAAAATGASLYAIDRGLKETLVNLRGSILQTSTLANGQGSGGEVVFSKLDLAKPRIVHLVVKIAEEEHRFDYTIVKER